jgi:hypothetical protein
LFKKVIYSVRDVEKQELNKDNIKRVYEALKYNLIEPVFKRCETEKNTLNKNAR